jgi:hypothetical protein
VQDVLRRLGSRTLSLVYNLLGWVLGIAIFLVAFFVLTEHLVWGSITAFWISGIAAFVIVALIGEPIESRQKRRRHDRFVQKLRSPQWPVSLATGAPTSFARHWEAGLWIPAATIFLDADERALQILGHDLSHDVLLPVAMIEQVEFDPGDGPPYRQGKAVSWQRKWFGRPFPPTVFLGIRCAKSGELVVYPLCFHLHAAGDARDLHQRLKHAMESAAEPIPFRHSGEALESKLPPGLESRFLRTEILKRFWPDYRPTVLREWLNR